MPARTLFRILLVIASLLSGLVLNPGPVFSQVEPDSGGALIDTMTIGLGANGIEIDAKANRIYAMNFENIVSVIDGFTREVIQTLEFEQDITDLAFNHNTNILFVGHIGSISFVNVLTGEIDSLKLEDGAKKLAVNPETNTLFAIGSSDSYAINGNTMSIDGLGFDSATDIAVNPTTNNVYLIDYDYETSRRPNLVYVLDGLSYALKDRVEVGSPASLAVGKQSNAVYVASYNSDVYVLDGASSAVINRIESVCNYDSCIFDYLFADPVSDRAYALWTAEDGSVQVLTVVDARLNEVVNDIQLAGGSAGVVDPSAGLIYVGYANKIAVIDSSIVNEGYLDIKDLVPIKVLTPSSSLLLDLAPRAAGYDEMTNEVYIIGDGTDFLVMDEFSRQVSNVPGLYFSSFRDMAVNSETGKVYAISGDSVKVIDRDKYEVTKSIPIGQTWVPYEFEDEGYYPLFSITSTEPTGIAVNSDTNTVYVSTFDGFIMQEGNEQTYDSRGHALVYVIDGTTDDIVDVIQTFAAQGDIAVDPFTNRVYVAGPEGAIAVIDGSTNRVVQGISDESFSFSAFGQKTFDAEINTKTKTLYFTQLSTDGSHLAIADISGRAEVVATVDGLFQDIEVDSNSNLVYLSKDNLYEIAVLDGSINEIVASIALGGQPGSLIFSPNTDTLYASRPGQSNAISQVEGSKVLSFIGNPDSQDRDDGITDSSPQESAANPTQDSALQPTSESGAPAASSETSAENNAGPEQTPPQSGCLIATAAYGSEFAPQVQMLREIRDNQLLKTSSGSAFMSAFNSFYYSWSPTVAEWERQNPAFKEVVRVAITPLIATLSILPNVSMDSEEEALGYGIGVILLNIGIYFVAPAFAVMFARIRFRKEAPGQ